MHTLCTMYALLKPLSMNKWEQELNVLPGQIYNHPFAQDRRRLTTSFWSGGRELPLSPIIYSSRYQIPACTVMMTLKTPSAPPWLLSCLKLGTYRNALWTIHFPQSYCFSLYNCLPYALRSAISLSWDISSNAMKRCTVFLSFGKVAHPNGLFMGLQGIRRME